MTAFQPRTLLAVAERLCGDRDEASHRSAMSRAYYGAFLVARNALDIRDMSPEVHGLAQRELQNIGLPHLSQTLDALRKLRNKADYDTTLRFRRHDASGTVRQAQLMLDQLAEPATQRMIRRYLARKRVTARAAPLSPARWPPVPRGRARR